MRVLPAVQHPRICLISEEPSAVWTMEAIRHMFNDQVEVRISFSPDVIEVLRPTHVILDGLVNPSTLVDLVNAYPQVVWVVRVISKPTLLAYAHQAYQRLFSYQELVQHWPGRVRLAVTHTATQRELRTVGLATDYLPDVCRLAMAPPKDGLAAVSSSGLLAVGSYGFFHMHMLAVATAAVRLANRLKVPLAFHISRASDPSSLVENLRALLGPHAAHRLVDVGYHPSWVHVGVHDGTMAVSDDVAMTYTQLGTPVIGSTDVSWLTASCKVDLSDSDTTFGRMLDVLESKTYVSINQEGLASFVGNGLDAWKQFGWEQSGYTGPSQGSSQEVVTGTGTTSSVVDPTDESTLVSLVHRYNDLVVTASLDQENAGVWQAEVRSQSDLGHVLCCGKGGFTSEAEAIQQTTALLASLRGADAGPPRLDTYVQGDHVQFALDERSCTGIVNGLIQDQQGGLLWVVALDHRLPGYDFSHVVVPSVLMNRAPG